MIFDFIVIGLVLTAIYFGYRFGTSLELYRLVKTFVILTLSSAYSGTFGSFLTKMGILKANDWAVLSLTGFLVLFLILWGIIYLIEKMFLAKDLHKSKLNRYLGMLLGGVQALILVTFLSFMSTQLTFVKEGYKSYLISKSAIYIHMDRLCRKIVTANFVDSILHKDGEASTEDILIKTLGSAAVLKEIIK